MFYIVSDAGIVVNETDRVPIFIPKLHKNYDSILSQIDNLSFNELKALSDNKTFATGYINEHIESYENDCGDFEIRIADIPDLESYVRNTLTYELGFAGDKGKTLLDILNNSKISSIKITLN